MKEECKIVSISSYLLVDKIFKLGLFTREEFHFDYHDSSATYCGCAGKFLPKNQLQKLS